MIENYWGLSEQKKDDCDYKEDFFRGHKAFYQGQFDDSLMYFQSVLDEDRENPESWYNVGVIFAELEDYDRAIDHFDKALEIDPYDVSITEARHLAKQRKYLSQYKINID
jgi:tetratricopeptide (TPR) repeat protein